MVTLSDKQLREFAECFRPEKKETPTIKINATVRSIDTTGQDPVYYVDFDGAEGIESCPVSSTLGNDVLSTDDRVVVLVDNREGTIVGNISNPTDKILIQKINEGLSTAGVQWLAWPSDTNPPSASESGWSNIMPPLTTQNPYLWQKSGNIIQLANVMSGLYVFMNNVGETDSSGNYTMIDGEKIKTGTLSADKIAVGSDYLDIKLNNIDTDISTAQSTANTASTNAANAKTRADNAYTLAQNAGATATNYITTISGRTGICVHNSNDLSNYCNINSSGLGVWVGGALTSSFGSNTIELGKNNSNSVIKMCNNDLFMYGTDTNYNGGKGRFLYIGNNYVPKPNDMSTVILTTLTESQIKSASFPSKLAEISTSVIAGEHNCEMFAFGPGSTQQAGVSVGSDGWLYLNASHGIEFFLGGSKNFRFYVGENDDQIMASTYDSSRTPKRRVYFPPAYADLNSGTTAKINSNGLLNISSSKRSHKMDITDSIDEKNNPHKIYDLSVKQFKYKSQYQDSEDYKFGKDTIGFIAEEIAESYPLAAYYENDGTPADWDDRVLIPALVKIVQELHSDIELLKERTQ